MGWVILSTQLVSGGYSLVVSSIIQRPLHFMSNQIDPYVCLLLRNYVNDLPVFFLPCLCSIWQAICHCPWAQIYSFLRSHFFLHKVDVQVYQLRLFLVSWRLPLRGTIVWLQSTLGSLYSLTLLVFDPGYTTFLLPWIAIGLVHIIIWWIRHNPALAAWSLGFHD